MPRQLPAAALVAHCRTVLIYRGAQVVARSAAAKSQQEMSTSVDVQRSRKKVACVLR
jgi:hypothetical protein